MRTLLSIITFAMLSAFSHSSLAAKSWGITNEQEAVFTGTVVDIACELTGDCPANCGEGKRQLGLKTADQGVILVAKNLTFYTGAAEELYGFCGQEIEVDGLFSEHRNIRFFQVQSMRIQGEKWEKADRFLDAWAEDNNSSKRKAKKWYTRDPRVEEILNRDGRLGLGPEADAEYFGN